jgi:uncharacterized protein
MIIEDTFTVEAPIQKVWDFFLDFEQMGKCMPGAEVRQTDPGNFEGDLKVKVGPLGAAFSGTVTITEQMPPNTITAAVKAKDKGTGSMAQGEFSSSLRRIDPGTTEVSYRIDVTIRGKIGQFGQTVIQDTARRLTAEFLACVKAQIETPEGEIPPPPLSQAKATRVGIVAFVGASFNGVRRWVLVRLGRRKQPEQP